MSNFSESFALISPPGRENLRAALRLLGQRRLETLRGQTFNPPGKEGENGVSVNCNGQCVYAFLAGDRLPMSLTTHLSNLGIRTSSPAEYSGLALLMTINDGGGLSTDEDIEDLLAFAKLPGGHVE